MTAVMGEVPGVERTCWKLAVGSASAGLAATAAWASEAITYTYDAKGRLVKVERTGDVNNNVKVAYTQDKADNRARVTATGPANHPPP